MDGERGNTPTAARRAEVCQLVFEHSRVPTRGLQNRLTNKLLLSRLAPSLLGGSEAGAAPRRVPARATVRDSSHDVVLSRARSASPAMSGVGMKREHAQMASGAPLERAVPPPPVDAGAGTVALPRRPDFGREGRPIGLYANHFLIKCDKMPELTLYDVTITPPPPRGPPKAQTKSVKEEERKLPPRLCRCVRLTRVAR